MLDFSEIKYKKTNDPWQMQAWVGNYEFYFSGVFNPARLRKESIVNFLLFFQKIILIFLVFFGIAAFIFNLWQEFWLLKNYYFLFKPTNYNLIFWLGCFSANFLWALKKEDSFNKQALNLLQLNPVTEKKKTSVDIYELFNSQSKKIWNQSLKYSSKTTTNQNNNTFATPSLIDLFNSLLTDKQVKIVFLRLGIDYEDIQKLLTNYSLLSKINDQNEFKYLPFVALIESVRLHNKTIDPLMLLCALTKILPDKHFIQSIFLNINLSLEKLEIISSWIFQIQLLIEELNIFKKLSRFKTENEINTGLTSIPTFYLDRFSVDLTRQAKHGSLPISIGRRFDLDEIFKLANGGQKHLLIKGAPGSGRTTLINELAYKMATEQVPKIFSDKRLVKIEIASIVGQTQKAENVLIHLLNEAEKSGNVVLVLEDLSMLAKTTGSSGLSLLEVLTEHLYNHNLTVVATTNEEDFVDHLQQTTNFTETFTVYELKKLSRSEILLACAVKASLLEGKNNCFFRYQAIESAVDLTDLYIKDIAQPQKAISILIEAASLVKEKKQTIISEAIIQEQVSKKTHIPTQTFTENEAEKLLNLEASFEKRVIGQKQAIIAVSEGLRRARSGLASLERPLASFLFLGPTGVGKTEVAKSLAAVYFGDEKFLLRLDMSEFRGADAIEKLLGIIGSKIDTPIVKHIKTHPFSLLLLDEFEKASPEILNLFLQILEDGRLTTTKGETLDLTHVLIIATSNAGSKEIQNGIKNSLGYDQIKSKLFTESLPDYFTPELLNRFDGVILFTPLSQPEVEKITILQLEILKSELLKKGIKVQFEQSLVQDIAEKGYEPSFGARPIRRYIQDHLESFIAKLILQKELKRGSEVCIGIKNGEYFLA